MSTGTGTRRTSKRRMEREVAKFDRRLKRFGHVLVDKFGEDQAEAMREEMLDEYRRLIPGRPYVGRRNRHSAGLTLAQQSLASYRVVVGHGGTVEDAGELMHRMMRGQMEQIPKVLRHWMGRQRFGRLNRRKLERAALRSQARRYPGDWVFERIEGDGETFDFGIDYTECGIVKYLHAQGADELTPYGCDLDYVMLEAMGVGFRRTKTLAWGCDRCDFRLSRDGATTAPWPPEFVERTCGEPVTESEKAPSPS